MGDPPIQVRDPSRIHCLVMPSPRVHHHHQPLLSSSASLFKGLGGMQGVSAGGGIPPICSVSASCLESGGGCLASSCQGGASNHTSNTSNSSQGANPVQTGSPPSGTTVTVPGWATPAGYAVCGLGLGLCNLLAPGYIQTCANLLCPLWTISLGLHIAGTPSIQSDSCWAWTGVLTLFLLPFVISIASPLFVGFYLLVFAGFSSGLFWQRLQGAAFILAWLCWAGLLVACGLNFGGALPAQMNLCVAAFFSISLGVINSGGCKFIMHVG